jgi:tetratricopeptide (TPR) repeat protein
MKKIAAIIVICWSFLAQAQAKTPEAGEMKFDQHVANCENKWFGARTVDGKVVLGYVYIDPTAGFTFENYGHLDISDGKLHAIKSDLYGKARVITRIGQNFPATCLSEAQATTLGLPSSPESMKFYTNDRTTGEHHASWAYHYNHIGASEIALDHVSKAIAAGYSSTGLTFEHAFALNALGKFDQTAGLLAPVVASSTKTADLIAELAYAKLMQGEYQQAIDLYSRAIRHRGRDGYSQRRWEFARNIGAAYEALGDLKQRDQWIKRSDRYRKDGK